MLTAPYEDRDGCALNAMLVDGTLYLEEHVTDAKLVEKYIPSLVLCERVQTSLQGESCTEATPADLLRLLVRVLVHVLPSWSARANTQSSRRLGRRR